MTNFFNTQARTKNYHVLTQIKIIIYNYFFSEIRIKDLSRHKGKTQLITQNTAITI